MPTLQLAEGTTWATNNPDAYGGTGGIPQLTCAEPGCCSSLRMGNWGAGSYHFALGMGWRFGDYVEGGRPLGFCPAHRKNQAVVKWKTLEPGAAPFSTIRREYE